MNHYTNPNFLNCSGTSWNSDVELRLLELGDLANYFLDMEWNDPEVHFLYLEEFAFPQAKIKARLAQLEEP